MAQPVCSSGFSFNGCILSIGTGVNGVNERVDYKQGREADSGRKKGIESKEEVGNRFLLRTASSA